jgi:HK97 family phage major capsid protein
MSTNTEKRATLQRELDSLIATYGENPDAWPLGQAKLAERITRGLEKLDTQDDLDRSRAARADLARTASVDPRNRENGFGAPMIGSFSNNTDPYAGLGTDISRSDSLDGLNARAHTVIERMEDHVPDEGREKLARLLEQDGSLDSAALVLALSDPAYTRAFVKVTRSQYGYRAWDADEQRAYSRVEACRAAMGESGSATYLVPIPLDPTIVLTNAGIINPVRSLARVETTANAVWTGAASAGSTAYWTAENTALTEANPTLTQLTVTPRKMTGWLTGSLELVMDSNVTQQVPQLLADAFSRLEGDAFINGNGTTQPQGIITAISATIGSTVTATTRGSFTSASVTDLYNVDNVLPARARQGAPAWVMNRKTINTIRQMSAAAQGSSFWANLGDTTPTLLLDHPLYEASPVLSTTTTGSVLAVLADFRQYLIVDRIGSAAVEYVQNVVDTNGVPTGTRGWVGYKRTGAVMQNVDAARFLLM